MDTDFYARLRRSKQASINGRKGRQAHKFVPKVPKYPELNTSKELRFTIPEYHRVR